MYLECNLIPDIPSGTSKFSYPDLDFLENDLGLWDTFFSHSKNSSRFQSVLRPPLPIDEYLKKTTEVKKEPTLPPPEPTTTPIIHDSASLRALLPAAQKHLVPRNPESQLER